ncbi:hypothetical protein CASFOL_014206 [Castilleja foliolosa]|uniref:F-box domain-containing protein n=1 Tax=Castilleja foliolosa TaxID=1961234 RepID=A0ABD3DRA0_9LAMI
MGLNGIEKIIILRGCNKTRFLPEDVLVQILFRLPVKALVRFKSVSKAWYFIISRICIQYTRPAVDGLFLRTYHPFKNQYQYISRTPRNPLLTHFFSDQLPEKWCLREVVFGNFASLSGEEEVNSRKAQVFGWKECIDSFRLPFKPDPDDLIASCNGLLLFVDIDSSRYYVSNPLTRQCVSIPPPPWTQKSRLYAALAFDPSKSSHYKVVRFAWPTTQPDMVLDIYSSADKSWSSHSLQLDPRITTRNMIRPATYFDGAFFRLSVTWHVVRFDVRDQVSVGVIQLPSSYKECNRLMGSMGLLKGSLSYANDCFDMLHIWSLENIYGENIWNLRYKINIHDLTCGLVLHRECAPACSEWIGPIAFHPSANVVYLGTSIVILRYNLENNKLEELTRIEEDSFLPGCYCAALTYVRYLGPFNDDGHISALHF